MEQQQQTAPRLKKVSKNGPFKAAHCAMTKGATMWCYGLCRPVKGMGVCGRPAYKVLAGRTQKAIAKHLEKKAEDE